MSGGMYCGVPSKPGKCAKIIIAISATLMALALCSLLALMGRFGVIIWDKLSNEYEYHYYVGQEVQVKHTNYTGVIVARVGGTYHLRINQTLAVVYDIQEFELEAK